MNSEQPNTHLGWHGIEPHTLTLCGSDAGNLNDASCIEFVTNSVLACADEISRPAAIGFKMTVRIPLAHLLHTQILGYYGSLEEFRSQLRALRQQEATAAEVQMDRLQLILRLPQDGTELIVEGLVSNVQDSIWPWASSHSSSTNWPLRADSPAYCLRFSFRTPLIDPPYLDRFIRDIDALLLHLQQYSK